MKRISMNRAHILVALLSVALSLMLVACASSNASAPQRQQFSSPPTQEEIDEFRRAHPVYDEVNASMVWIDINTFEGKRLYDDEMLSDSYFVL